MPAELLVEPLVAETKTPRQHYTPKTDLPTLGRAAQGSQLSWITAIFMVAFHIGAIAALFFFSWGAVIAAAILYVFAINMGIGMGYHRLLTHRGYKTPSWVEYFLAVCATLSLEGGPIFWVATHRVHHQLSDKTGDPHTPTEGGWWAHVGWILSGESLHAQTVMLARYAPDLTKDRFHVWLSKYHWIPLTAVGLGLLAIGGWTWVLWGIFFRVTLGLHSTWLVNSATHMWGSRRFPTRDESRNNWWVALLTGGEGWHNNHHAHPVSARHGLKWYEFDPNYYGIWVLKKLGLARDIKIAQYDPQNPRPAGTA
ncbi:MAG: fatty acid desaturase [Alloacidobacterium sp.]|jgi:fatty-acid desaturase